MMDVPPVDQPWEALTPADASELLRHFEIDWWISGGWALELFAGHYRTHVDLDVAINRSEAHRLHVLLPGWQFYLAHGGMLRPWVAGETIPAEVSELWSCRRAGCWAVEFAVENFGGPRWEYRRCPRVTLPRERFGLRDAAGVPFERPEVALLYRCRGRGEPKHQLDFEAVVPRLDLASRGWLREAMGTAHPDSPWLAQL